MSGERKVICAIEYAIKRNFAQFNAKQRNLRQFNAIKRDYARRYILIVLYCV